MIWKVYQNEFQTDVDELLIEKKFAKSLKREIKFYLTKEIV